jgi:Gpi18-like mannosyltransferase
MRISRTEEKILEYIKKNLLIFYIAAITLISAVVRFSMRWFDSCDMSGCLVPWFNEINNAGGLSALKNQVGDYNIVYQTIIALLTYLPFPAIHMYKILSIIFDYVLAFGTALFVYKIKNKSKMMFTVVYSAIIMMPTVMLNSAAWGQCDSIYVSFIIISIILLTEQHYTASFIFLGISFIFKLQFIFILPFFIYYYFSTKAYSIVNFLLIPLVAWASSIPMVIYGQRSIFEFFKIYFEQTDEYETMGMFIANIWQLAKGEYESTKILAIGLTVAILAGGLFIIIWKNIDLKNTEIMLTAACWSVWTCIEFLPAMHERYTYLLDILLLVLAAYKFRTYVLYFVLCLAVSITTYSQYLYANIVDIQWVAFVYLMAYCVFSLHILKKCLDDDKDKLNKNI